MTIAADAVAAMNFHSVRSSFESFPDATVDNGVDKIELWGAAPHFYIEDKTLAEARALGATSRGLDLISFAPERCVYPINVAAEEPALRDRSIRYVLESLEMVVERGAPDLVVTPGTGYRDRSVDNVAPHEPLATSVSALRAGIAAVSAEA